MGGGDKETLKHADNKAKFTGDFRPGMLQSVLKVPQ